MAVDHDHGNGSLRNCYLKNIKSAVSDERGGREDGEVEMLTVNMEM